MLVQHAALAKTAINPVRRATLQRLAKNAILKTQHLQNTPKLTEVSFASQRNVNADMNYQIINATHGQKHKNNAVPTMQKLQNIYAKTIKKYARSKNVWTHIIWTAIKTNVLQKALLNVHNTKKWTTLANVLQNLTQTEAKQNTKNHVATQTANRQMTINVNVKKAINL